MKKYANIYLVFALLGTMIPWLPFVSWLKAGGGSPSVFIKQAFANQISSFFVLDLLLSGVFLLFVIGVTILSKRIKIFLMLATLLVGVSASLPLYFYFTQRDN